MAKTKTTSGSMTIGCLKENLQPPSEEIYRLHMVGFSLLPLGGGSDGKKPLTGFKNDPVIPLKRVLGAMYGRNSLMYGVRLGGLLVVDIDTDTPEVHAYVEEQFGVSTVQIKTPRGRHHYFKLPKGTPVPSNLRQAGIAIDFKRGVNSYVAGPLSVRPDGGCYVPMVGILGETELPVFCPKTRSPESGNICNNKPSPLFPQ